MGWAWSRLGAQLAREFARNLDRSDRGSRAPERGAQSETRRGTGFGARQRRGRHEIHNLAARREQVALREVRLLAVLPFLRVLQLGASDPAAVAAEIGEVVSR